MNKIILKKLTLLNFKGIRSLSIDFDQKETNIYGANGVGKTTVVDSYNWLLYGKDSSNKTDFDIKTLDQHNKPIHNLNHEVEGVFLVDGSEIVLKRVYVEKWQKKKGNEVSELTGHTTNYFINEVPVSLSEYKTKVESFLNEDLQKVLSNPLYFNQIMKWNDRRLVLSRLVGEISDESVVKGLDENSKECISKLFQTEKTLDDYKREYQSKRKKVKDELDTLPSRIDEAQRSIPEDKDWSLIESQIKSKEESIIEIDNMISDKVKELDSQFEEIKKVKQLKFSKEQELNDEIENCSKDLKNEIQGVKTKISDLEHSNYLIGSKIKNITSNIGSLETGSLTKEQSINSLIAENSNLRQIWNELNAEELKFDEKECVCPTCNREYDSSKVSEIKDAATKNFYENKDVKLSDITSQGQRNKTKIEALKNEQVSIEEEIKNFKTEIEKLKAEQGTIEVEISTLKEKLEKLNSTEIVESDKVKSIKKEIESISIPEVKEVNTDDLKQRKSSLQSELKQLQEQLFEKKQIEVSKARVIELNEQQLKLSQQIAGYEKYELAIDKFNKAKIDFIESSINKKFKNIKFKMFEEQVNGGYSENCICLMNGVNFDSLNTASKINAGIECINVISEFYQTQVPLFLDGRESVTNITETDSQVINLFVHPSATTLKF